LAIFDFINSFLFANVNSLFLILIYIWKEIALISIYSLKNFVNENNLINTIFKNNIIYIINLDLIKKKHTKKWFQMPKNLIKNS
jgi:hypothetical protein